MKRIYYCPKCSGVLNPNVKIILTAQKGSKRGLVLFSPQPGNYKVFISGDIGLKTGDEIEFLCPLCNADLTSDHDESLSTIGFRLDSGHEGLVAFSKVYGEKATYFVTSEEIRSFGEDAENYTAVNFFGEGNTSD